jgi:hypothetical protein
MKEEKKARRQYPWGHKDQRSISQDWMGDEGRDIFLSQDGQRSQTRGCWRDRVVSKAMS